MTSTLSATNSSLSVKPSAAL